jgi:hypothetical protein
MFARDLKRKEQKNKRRRLWLLSPGVLAALTAVMLIGGVGTGFSLTQTTVTDLSQPWAGTATIIGTVHFNVSGYSLVPDETLGNISGVSLYIINSSGTTVSVKVAALNNSTGLVASNESATKSYVSGNYTFTWTGGNISIPSIDKLNIWLTEP